MKRVVICDANILIDYAKANTSIIVLTAEHLYDLCVPSPVWEEVENLSSRDAKEFGLNIVEPSLAQTYEAANMHGGGLSDEDHMCFIMARDEKAICATNEKPLRKKCEDSNIEVLWGLEIMAQLYERGKLSSGMAAKTAQKIASDNPTITETIINRFLNRISEKQ